jgi:outer membrane protein OmpA-like peptidoglycan-associated protein
MTMVHKHLIAMMIGIGCLLFVSSRNQAQEPQEVQQLTDPTSKTFQDALNYQKGVTPTEKPRCQEFQDVRGVTPKAVAAFEVQFAFNSHELSSEATKVLDQLGDALNSVYLLPYCFRLEGHTDSVGSDVYNQSLSVRRANSVMQYLISRQQVDEKRLLPVGYGKTHPIADNNTDEGRQKNRRVQVANLGQGPSANSQPNN